MIVMIIGRWWSDETERKWGWLMMRARATAGWLKLRLESWSYSRLVQCCLQRSVLGRWWGRAPRGRTANGWILQHYTTFFSAASSPMAPEVHLLTVECELASMSCVHSISMGVVAIIPLIDAASNDDSNGGYIIFWSILTSAVKIRPRWWVWSSWA